jgi:hypothetical protein
MRENVYTHAGKVPKPPAQQIPPRIGPKSRIGIARLNIYCGLMPQRFAMTINYLLQFASAASLTGRRHYARKPLPAAFLETAIES